MAEKKKAAPRRAAAAKKKDAPGEETPGRIEGGLASRIPALAAYLERVGAEELNFRRFMVKQYVGERNYYVERTLIRINADGSISCSREEHEPTAEERKAIGDALQKIDLPKSVHATVESAQAHARTLRGKAFLFYVRRDRGKDLVSMIQERWVKEDGSKIHVAWSFWSDGEWRRMEPDGPLPIWKPARRGDRRGKGRIMIHEGAKSAAHVDALVNDEELRDELHRHPWGTDLATYEHWGMIGGALAPHRTDYAELARENPTEVVYVCDNDFAGESALQEVSRFWGNSLLGVMFGDSFPPSWDMADPMPESLFVGEGAERRYHGPTLAGLMRAATRATELVPNPSGRGRTMAVLRRAFAEEWLHAIKPEVFVHRDWPHEMWTANEFNSKVRPFSDVDDTARLLRANAASKSAVLKYDPSSPPGVYESNDEGRYINTHRPSAVRPERGDPEPFLEFMRALVPGEEDRLELMRWCATLIARPDIRMTYGVLLISEQQGVGKGTLGEKILAPLVGHSNVSYPSEQEIVDSNFNYWLAHKRLAVVHEIYAGHSSKAYNRLKSVITDRYVTVSKKYMANYDIENYMHVYANSNSWRAIQVTGDDRRWHLPGVTEERRPPQYWISLNRWLSERGGLGIIRAWASDFLRKHSPVLQGDVAPWSALKREVIEEGYSPGMRLVSETLERVRSVLEEDTPENRKMREDWEKRRMLVGGAVVILDRSLVDLITRVVHQGRQSDRLERPMTVRKIAKHLRWHAGKRKISPGTMAWGARAHHSRVISNCPRTADEPLSDLVKRIAPLDLGFAAEM